MRRLKNRAAWIREAYNLIDGDLSQSEKMLIRNEINSLLDILEEDEWFETEVGSETYYHYFETLRLRINPRFNMSSVKEYSETEFRREIE